MSVPVLSKHRVSTLPAILILGGTKLIILFVLSLYTDIVVAIDKYIAN